jgi:TRAP transporter TAXI family solute receptor
MRTPIRKMLTSTLAASALLALGVGAASADTVRLMTGPQGGVWVPLGGALKAMWEKAVPGEAVQTLPGAGIANVKAIEGGKAEIGFANSISTVDAIKGEAPFDKKATNVCHLGTLYPQYFQVVVLADVGINSVKDLKGKSIAVQPKGNTAEDVTRHLLQAHGMSYNDLGKVNFMSYTDAVSLLKDGHAQAFTLGTTIPASSVLDLASGRDIKLLPADDGTLAAMKKINPGYTATDIPANTYPKQDKPVKVIAYATHLIASCKLPEDNIYKMTKAMVTGLPDLVAVNGAMKGLTTKQMAEDIGVPLHPGAAKVYKESGAL